MKRIPVAINLVALLILSLAIVTVTWLASRANTQTQTDTLVTLQAENVQLHSLLNESETKRAELLAVVDWVDRAAYWTGYYQSCMDVAGLQEPDCYSLMETRQRAEATQ